MSYLFLFLTLVCVLNITSSTVMEIKGNNMSFIDTALIYTLTSTPGTSLKISRSILGTDINSTTLLELDKDIIKAADDLVITGKHNVTYSDMYVRNIKQWNILYFDDFETKHSIHGWSLNATTTCGYKKNHILGGYCKLSSSEINKVYITEETHTHLRIRGQIYIIDQWENNYLIISVDGKPRWKKSFSWCNAMHKDLCMLKKINVCGHHIPDSIAITFDFTFPHKEDKLELSMKSDLKEDKGCKASWGIDNIQIDAITN